MLGGGVSTHFLTKFTKNVRTIFFTMVKKANYFLSYEFWAYRNNTIRVNLFRVRILNNKADKEDKKSTREGGLTKI